MARPRKANRQQQSNVICFRLTDEQKAELEKEAAALNLRPSDYARMRYMGGKVKVVQVDGFPQDAVHQLRRLGVNLFRLLRHCETYCTEPPPYLETLCQRIEDLLDRAFEQRHGSL